MATSKLTAKLVAWTSKDGTKEGYSYVPGSDTTCDTMLKESETLAKQQKELHQRIADRIGQAADLPDGTLAIAFTRWGDMNVFEAKAKGGKAAATKQTTNVGDAFKKKA